MASTAVTTPWELTTEYLMLTQRVGPPGGATQYTTPHPSGISATDVTTFVYGQATITIDNWPNIMYVLEPDQAWKNFQKSGPPEAKKDQHDQPIMERFPRAGKSARPLLDFPVLPDNISSTEDWWWFDLWRRVDPRIRWEDITMRIEQPRRTRETDTRLQNAIQTMAGRKWHAKYFILSWFPKGVSRNAHSKTQVLNALAAAQIPRQLNTTRGLTPGLVDPSQPAGARIPHPVMTGTRRVPLANSRPTRTTVAVQVEESDEVDASVESDHREGDHSYAAGDEDAEGDTDEEVDTPAEGPPAMSFPLSRRENIGVGHRHRLSYAAEDEDAEGDTDEEVYTPAEQQPAMPSPPLKRGNVGVGHRRRRSSSTPTPSRPRKIQRAQRHPSVSQAAQRVADPNNICYHGATVHHHYHHFGAPAPTRHSDMPSPYANVIYQRWVSQAPRPGNLPAPSWTIDNNGVWAPMDTVNPRDINPFS